MDYCIGQELASHRTIKHLGGTCPLCKALLTIEIKESIIAVLKEVVMDQAKEIVNNKQ